MEDGMKPPQLKRADADRLIANLVLYHLKVIYPRAMTLGDMNLVLHDAEMLSDGSLGRAIDTLYSERKIALAGTAMPTGGGPEQDSWVAVL
jgi:hypothetical protein